MENHGITMNVLKIKFYSTKAKTVCRNGKATSKLWENILFQLWNDMIHVAIKN